MIKLKKINISKRSIVMIALLLISLLFIFVVSKIVTQPDFNASTVQSSLNDKELFIMKLAAAAAAASTALSLIPGDASMPIANQIAELAPYFILILGSILWKRC